METIYFTVRYCFIFIVLYSFVYPQTHLNKYHGEGSSHFLILKIRANQDSILYLPHQFIIPGSEILQLDSSFLNPISDYSFQYRSGILRFTNLAINDTLSHELKISYQALPLIFKDKYQHQKVFVLSDSLDMENAKSTKPPSSFDVDDIFGSNLRKSGSIVRGFTLGTNRDFSLNSGFRMQMSGNLLDDLEVVATLTDENSPIQPEGTTQTLQEVDKVFIELRSSSYSAAMGDINLDITGNEFGNLRRKMSGAKGFANYKFGGLNGDVLLTGAVTRGKYTSNQFLGVDGVQGPYRLVDVNGNRSIIVIAGTERVYINGEKMTRGENNDYIIDYSTAEITFTPKRYISKDTRIVVDFEYNDRQYNRNLWGAKTGFKLFKNRMNFNTTFVTESDNRNNPIDISLTDDDKKILSAAGGNRNMARKSGVELFGIGKGQYKVLDSTITIGGKDTVLKIYEFAPTDTMNAIYSIIFSFVGSGKGSYKKVASGQYEFIGIDQGSYEPIRFLPLPQSNRLIDFDLNGEPTDNLSLSGEYALSNFNANQFSDLPGTQISGMAYKFGIAYSFRDIKIAKLKLGSVDVSVKDRYINKDFIAMDRFNEVEYNRKWNLIDTLKQNENSIEGTIAYIPVNGMLFKGEVGKPKCYQTDIV